MPNETYRSRQQFDNTDMSADDVARSRRYSQVEALSRMLSTMNEVGENPNEYLFRFSEQKHDLNRLDGRGIYLGNRRGSVITVDLVAVPIAMARAALGQ